MFEGWDSFYLLVGGGAGALIGTMFVVATLTAGMDPGRMKLGARIYITPIVFHFGVVLGVSVVTAIPHLPLTVLSSVLALAAAYGAVYTAMTTYRLMRLKWGYDADLSDKFFYGAFPFLTYLALGATAVSVWFASESAPYAIGTIMLVLLLIGIRNAWDLATAIVQQAPSRDADK